MELGNPAHEQQLLDRLLPLIRGPLPALAAPAPRASRQEPPSSGRNQNVYKITLIMSKIKS